MLPPESVAADGPPIGIAVVVVEAAVAAVVLLQLVVVPSMTLDPSLDPGDGNFCSVWC